MATTHHPPTPSSIMHVVPHAVGRRAVLTVEGEVDISTVAVLAAAIDRVVDDGAAELWLDLSTTTFMDSVGVHLLLTTRQRLAELNRELAVVAPTAGVRRLLEMVGVTELLAVHPDRHTAHLAR